MLLVLGALDLCLALKLISNPLGGNGAWSAEWPRLAGGAKALQQEQQAAGTCGLGASAQAQERCLRSLQARDQQELWHLTRLVWSLLSHADEPLDLSTWESSCLGHPRAYCRPWRALSPAMEVGAVHSRPFLATGKKKKSSRPLLGAQTFTSRATVARFLNRDIVIKRLHHRQQSKKV